MHDRRAKDRGRGAQAEREPPAADQITAQEIELVAMDVFRNVPLGGERQAQVDEVSEQQEPGPHVDVNAEFETAHRGSRICDRKTTPELATRMANAVPAMRRGAMVTGKPCLQPGG